MSEPSESPEPQNEPPAVRPPGKWQFTLGGFLMFVALVAILLPLVTVPSCGTHLVKISSLAFSPDGKRLAVARYEARLENIDFKFLLFDVSRTVSIVDVEPQRADTVVEQTIMRGNQGAGVGLFRHTSNCLAFGPEAIISVPRWESRLWPLHSGIALLLWLLVYVGISSYRRRSLTQQQTATASPV
jgi:hypothetical protein